MNDQIPTPDRTVLAEKNTPAVDAIFTPLEAQYTEINVRIEQVQTCLKQFYDVDAQLPGPEQRRLAVERDEVYAELELLVDRQYELERQLVWRGGGLEGELPPPDPGLPKLDMLPREQLRDRQAVRQRLVEVGLALAGLGAQLEMWRQHRALPPEERALEGRIGDSAMSDYCYLSELRSLLLLQLGWLTAGYVGLAPEVAASPLLLGELGPEGTPRGTVEAGDHEAE